MAYFFFLVLGANTWISIIGALTYSFATFQRNPGSGGP